MVTGIVLTVVSAVAVGYAWWAFVEPLAKRHRSTGDRPTAASAVYRRDPPLTAESDTRIPPHLTADWADHAQIWSALLAENALLADRLANRLDRNTYRTLMAELAQRCEPAQGDRR
ncbi:hypothetical protein [Nocardia sp. IFM 10818]